MNILHYDETETGPRLRKTLTDKHGITPELVRGNIGGVMIKGVYTEPQIDLYTYVRSSNGQRLWFIEMTSWYPPDVVLFQSWLLDTEPTDDQIRDIGALRFDCSYALATECEKRSILSTLRKGPDRNDRLLRPS